MHYKMENSKKLTGSFASISVDYVISLGWAPIILCSIVFYIFSPSLKRTKSFSSVFVSSQTFLPRMRNAAWYRANLLNCIPYLPTVKHNDSQCSEWVAFICHTGHQISRFMLGLPTLDFLIALLSDVRKAFLLFPTLVWNPVEVISLYDKYWPKTV